MAKMENNEAIEVLERHSQEFACDHGWNYSVLEALQIGIEALKTEQVTWIVGNNNAQVAVKNMPVDKLQKICAIIGGEVVGEPCEDAISRQAVLDYCIRYGKSDTWDYLNNLPSVQPIRPRGHWILVDSRVKGGYWKCSECLCHKTMGFGHTDLFCPNCGADMREETNHE